jgi:predicted TIM-barrel fold metal-dependent hydrolase
MRLSRREFVASAVGAALTPALLPLASARGDAADMLIIDTHQHLWDLSLITPPWLSSAPEILKKSYRTEEYLEATKGLNIKTVYMEVDVAPDDKVAEADYVGKLCESNKAPTLAAVMGGNPAADYFADYATKLSERDYVKGIRQVLHVPETPEGFCLKDGFVKNIQLLGEKGLSFDLCMRPRELGDGAKLAERCPDTRFVVDHCGNADPKAFGAHDEEPWHDADGWRRDMDRLAALPNVICKISGIVARTVEGWTSDDLAPIVNHCLDSFGPDRVVFGGDWPVCLTGAPLRQWVDALSEIISSRPADQQTKLWSGNAKKHYTLGNI